MFSHPHTRNKPLLKFALLSCLTLLFLLLFIFLTSGYANPHSTIYRYTHGYSEKYRSWLSSKLGVSKDSVQPPGAEDTEYEAEDEGKPQRTFNIALTERAGHHDEVLGAFLYTLSTSPRISNATVYRNSYRYKFSDIIKPFYPYPPLPADALFDALNTTFSSLNPNSSFNQNIQRHDALILSSCDQTLPTMLPSLLSSLSLLPQNHDFKILCIIHDAAHPPHVLAKISGPLVERGIITFVVLSHSAEWLVRESVFELAAAAGSDKTNDEVNEWDRVPVEVFLPIFPAPLQESVGNGVDEEDDLEAGDTVYENVRPKKRVLSNVIVQGNIDQHRRDYISLFRDLEEALHRDSAFWGYQALNASSSGAYEVLPSTSSSPPPFIVHLAGSLLPPTAPTQSPPIPSSLINVVQIHSSLSYPDFFSLMHDMDLVLPAFARAAYYKSSASSTVPASVIAEVPILATRWLLNAYQYLDARTSILRPAGMKEIEAVRLLRMGVLPDEYYYSNGGGDKGTHRRDISLGFDDWDEEDEEVIPSDDVEAYMYSGIADDLEEQLEGEQNQVSALPPVTINLATTTSVPGRTSNDDDHELERSTKDDTRESYKNVAQDILDTESEFDAANDQSAKAPSLVINLNTNSVINSDANSYEDGDDIESECPKSDIDLNATQNLLLIGKILQGDTTHPRARARSLLNSHSSRSLRPGAGSLLPRQNPRRGPVPSPQNPPQNTQDKRALLPGNLQRRFFSDEEEKDSKRERKKTWDGDMNTLTSRAAMRAMRREVYAKNEEVLLRAFGG